MPAVTCPTCGGTILAPSIGGADRGSCHCPRPRAKLSLTEAAASCPIFDREYEDFADDPITVAYGVQYEMTPVLVRSHVANCARCRKATTVGVPLSARVDARGTLAWS